MCKEIGTLFDQGEEYSDCILVAGEKEFKVFSIIILSFNYQSYIFKVYKGILACHSPVFAAMFRNKMKEAIEGRVEIEDIRANILEKMLRFM